jgi:hypothetical protein
MPNTEIVFYKEGDTVLFSEWLASLPALTSGLSQRNRYQDAIVAHALLRAAFTLV